MEIGKWIFDKLEKRTRNGIDFVVFLWQVCCASVGAYNLYLCLLLIDKHYFVTVTFLLISVLCFSRSYRVAL